MKRLTLSALALAAVAFLGACASSPKQAPIAANAPEWVNKGSGAFKDKDGKQVFYGVGIAQGIRNRALAVTAADDRGRAEIAKIMNSYVTSLTKDYMASVTAGDMTKSSEEQMVSQTMKNFAKFTLSGAMAGVAGYFSAAQFGFIAPQTLGWHVSATVLVMVLIGGLRSVAGPLVGALVLIGLEEVLKAATEYWKLAEGLVVIGIVLMLPNGVRQLLTLALGSDDRERNLSHAKSPYKGDAHG